MNLRSCIYHGTVTHQRLQPFRHRLAYAVYAFLIDLAEAPHLDTGSIWFGFNRKALLGFYEADHGQRDGSPLLPWVREKLAEAGLSNAGHRITLLCFPRVLNYSFNPISIFFCHDADDKIRAIIYEVKNTFGEQYSYLFPISGDGPKHTHRCQKEFYVSPFIAMNAAYEFTINWPDEYFSLFIRQHVDTGELLQASWNGKRLSWSGAVLRRCFWRYPLLSFKIIFSIHWHALRIYAKQAPYFKRPPLPAHDISVSRSTADE